MRFRRISDWIGNWWPAKGGATKSKAVACIECFKNTGFRNVISARSRVHSECPRCGKTSATVDADGLIEAVLAFFVSGSYIAETMAPVYQVTCSNPYPAQFDATLEADARLASEITGNVIFQYGPPMWRVGETTLKQDFDEGGEARTAALEAFIAGVPRIVLPKGTTLYRIRKDPELDETIVIASAFDPPPETVSRSAGRWDDGFTPVLYASDDIELCLHECRVALVDEIVVATLRCESDVTLLDLSAEIPTSASTEFDDPNMFANFLSLSRDEEWLGHARSVAVAAQEAGLSGIQYTSYYSQAKHDSDALNVALFGRPLSERMLSLQSINRIRIMDAQYSYVFGPVL